MTRYRAGAGDREDELMTVTEIAAYLRLNQQTIRNWIGAKKLPHVRLGERRIRVWRSDVEALINGSATGRNFGQQLPKTAGIWDGEVPAPVVPPGP